jgi:small-conductance mechanosensitive channel
VDWDNIDELLTGDELTAEAILVAVGLFAIGVLLAILIGWWRSRYLGRPEHQTEQVVSVIARVTQILVIAVFVGWALTVLGGSIGWLTVVLLVALAVAVMAGRPALEGLGASAALTSRAAFSVGDEIMVDDVVGEVLEITNYSTVIRLRDARRVHVSNVEMLTKTVTVFTVERERRSSVELSVALDTDIDEADHVIQRALEEVESISRVGQTRARGFDEGIELSFRFWHASDIEAGDEAIDGAVRAIKIALERNAIRFAPSSILRIDDAPDAAAASAPAPSTGASEA